jgi:hypothetical protein
MVISVAKPQEDSVSKTRLDLRRNDSPNKETVGICGELVGTDAPSMARFRQGDFLVYSRRQSDAEVPAEYEF